MIWSRVGRLYHVNELLSVHTAQNAKLVGHAATGTMAIRHTDL